MMQPLVATAMIPEPVPLRRHCADADDFLGIACNEALRPRAAAGTNPEKPTVGVHVGLNAHGTTRVQHAHVSTVKETVMGKAVQRVALQVAAGVPVAEGLDLLPSSGLGSICSQS